MISAHTEPTTCVYIYFPCITSNFLLNLAGIVRYRGLYSPRTTASLTTSAQCTPNNNYHCSNSNQHGQRVFDVSSEGLQPLGTQCAVNDTVVCAQGGLQNGSCLEGTVCTDHHPAACRANCQDSSLQHRTENQTPCR